MNWLKHTLINIFLIILISPFLKPTRGEIYVLLFAGVLIDADHLINDLSKKRMEGMNLKEIIKFWWDAGDKTLNEFHFLHNIELVAFLFALALAYSDALLFISLGFLSHLAGDAFLTIRYNKSLDKLRNFSLFCFLRGDY